MADKKPKQVSDYTEDQLASMDEKQLSDLAHEIALDLPEDSEIDEVEINQQLAAKVGMYHKKRQYKRRFDKYIGLADGNKVIALRFLKEWMGEIEPEVLDFIGAN